MIMNMARYEQETIVYIPVFFVVPGMVQHPFINLMCGNVPLLWYSLCQAVDNDFP